jgi:hypothetical protein
VIDVSFNVSYDLNNTTCRHAVLCDCRFLQVPSLLQLNLFGCRRASGPQLQVVLDRLPALQWISLNGCHGINTIHLTRKRSIA